MEMPRPTEGPSSETAPTGSEAGEILSHFQWYEPDREDEDVLAYDPLGVFDECKPGDHAFVTRVEKRWILIQAEIPNEQQGEANG
tara:strand:- start:3064 stop:3318 length:255 start_codon:yes stop_codon:yes gene_type:complete